MRGNAWRRRNACAVVVRQPSHSAAQCSDSCASPYSGLSTSHALSALYFPTQMMWGDDARDAVLKQLGLLRSRPQTIQEAFNILVWLELLSSPSS